MWESKDKREGKTFSKSGIPPKTGISPEIGTSPESVPESKPESKTGKIARGLRELSFEISGHKCGPALRWLILFNLAVLFCRPQNDLPIPHINIPFLVLQLSVVPFVLGHLFSLWRSFAQVKAIFLILALGAVHVPIALNNFWAFHTWRDLLQQQLCFLFPLIIFLSTGKSLRALVKVLIGIGIYLAVYGLTHGGVGPGGFLGDENDLALALLAFLGIPLLLIGAARGAHRKLLMVVVSLLILGGVVATSSRGGFVGLVGLFGYVYWKSPAKGATTFAAVLIALASVVFVPKEYWDDMSTIKETNTGTAKERREMWSVAINIWLHPPHFLFGTGMDNCRYWMSHFEPATNRSNYAKSYGGRAVHSSLFQLLPDLGLTGLLLFSWLVWTSFMGNSRLARSLKRVSLVVQPAMYKLGSELDNSSSVHSEDSTVVENVVENSASMEGEETPRWEESQQEMLEKSYYLLRSALREAQYTRALLLGINSSWVGAIGSGLFISALYYPVFWFLASLTVAVQAHSQRLLRGMQLVAEEASGLSMELSITADKQEED